jgi:basic membrane lipoprotein Med (substrate-binding protein (PBP1-ABC) superfamily)
LKVQDDTEKAAVIERKCPDLSNIHKPAKEGERKAVNADTGGDQRKAGMVQDSPLEDRSWQSSSHFGGKKAAVRNVPVFVETKFDSTPQVSLCPEWRGGFKRST